MVLLWWALPSARTKISHISTSKSLEREVWLAITISLAATSRNLGHDRSRDTRAENRSPYPLGCYREEFVYHSAIEFSLSHQGHRWLEDFVLAVNNKNLCVIPHCLEEKCEEDIKEPSTRGKDVEAVEVHAKASSVGTKSLCIHPLWAAQEGFGSGGRDGMECLGPPCERKAAKWIHFGRS